MEQLFLEFKKGIKLLIAKRFPKNEEVFQRPALGRKIYKDAMDYKDHSIICFCDDRVVEMNNTDKDWNTIANS